MNIKQLLSEVWEKIEGQQIKNVAVHGINVEIGDMREELIQELFPIFVEFQNRVLEEAAKVCDMPWNGDADSFDWSEACNDCASEIRKLKNNN